MTITEIANKLADIDAPDKWGDYCPSICKEQKLEVYKLAERVWLKRMATAGKLLVHPEVLEELKEQSWEANDLQKRMIWASVLASADGKDREERFKNIKNLLLKKYGRKWWEDVFQRKTNAWAARERIRKKTYSGNTVLPILAKETILFGDIFYQERDKALKMIPKS